MNATTGTIRSMPGKDEDPTIINQVSLDDTALALRTGDLALMNAWFAIPYTLETYDATRVMETEEDMNKLFGDVLTFYQTAGVTEIHRRCVSASRRSPEEIIATFETRLLHKTSLMVEPYPSMATMKWIGDRWLIVRTQYGIEHKNALSRVLAGTRAQEVRDAQKG